MSKSKKKEKGAAEGPGRGQAGEESREEDGEDTVSDCNCHEAERECEVAGRSAYMEARRRFASGVRRGSVSGGRGMLCIVDIKTAI